jgi:hypothetical protein
MAPTGKAGTTPPPDQQGEMLEREYGHSSGDRNSRTDEHDWKHFKDGKERTVHVDSDSEQSSDTHRRP